MRGDSHFLLSVRALREANILAKTICHLKMVSDKTTIFATVYTSEE